MRTTAAQFSLPSSATAGNTTPPPTLLQIAGIRIETPRLSDSVLVIIDAQREYLDGRLPLSNIGPSVESASLLLARARAANTPVIHVIHRGSEALFDPARKYFEIIEALKPSPGESVIEKALPNAFTHTDLEKAITATDRKNLIIIGYMTHNCVSATARSALDRGYRTTIVAAATATRDLSDSLGGTIPATVMQAASLAALGDRTANIVQTPDEIPD